MKPLLIFGSAIAVSLVLIGCNPIDENQNPHREDGNGSIDIDALPKSVLTQELKNAIAYMGNEERLAYDVYMNLYEHHLAAGTEIKQLKNIASNGEKTHVGIVQSLVRKYNLNEENLTNVNEGVADNTVAFEDMPRGRYDIPAIQALYDALYAKGSDSAQDSLEVGCLVEVTDINDLDHYLTLAEASDAADVTAAFEKLRKGSYNHYWAFDKGLKDRGISEGCCSLGTIDGINYCHPEYPQNTNSGNGQR